MLALTFLTNDLSFDNLGFLYSGKNNSASLKSLKPLLSLRSLQPFSQHPFKHSTTYQLFLSLAKLESNNTSVLLTNKINCKECLKNSRCFSSLGQEDLEQVKVNKLELHFKKGETICKQGAFASNILFIYQGFVKTYRETANDKNNIISVLPEGELIGLPSLFSGRVYPYSASAIEDCIICAIEIRFFENFIRTNGAFASQVIKCLNNSTIQNYDRYIFNTQRSLKGRLADILVYLSSDIYRSNEFKLSLSRNDLAEWTQMAPESVTRIFSSFKKDGIISVNGKKIRINNLEKLRMISLEE